MKLELGRPKRHQILYYTIAAFAEDMSDFLMTSEITESRAFVKSFVKEIKVKPGKATVYYTIPISQSTPKTAVLVGGGPGYGGRQES